MCACPRWNHEAGLATECPASNQLHSGRPTLGVLEGPWGHRAPDETPPPGCGWTLPLLKSFVLTVSVAPGPGRPPCGPWCRPEGPSSFTGMVLQQTADVLGVATGILVDVLSGSACRSGRTLVLATSESEASVHRKRVPALGRKQHITFKRLSVGVHRLITMKAQKPLLVTKLRDPGDPGDTFLLAGGALL